MFGFKKLGLGISILIVFLDMAAFSSPAPERISELSTEALMELSIEDLMNMEITLTSRNEESLFGAAAAASVISAEDIRRSGATGLPELLRMVPGLNVARINSHYWAISARGFRDIYANKLLVMVDNRTIYTSLFGGVFWDMEHLLLEDIERIEIVRGPGGTLWGANAVNGVIHIITKKASDTQGLLVSAATGDPLRGDGAVRYGLPLGERTHARAYVRSFNLDNSEETNGRMGVDEIQATHGGFRFDGSPSETDSWTVNGGAYRGDAGDTFDVFQSVGGNIEDRGRNVNIEGSHLVGRWAHEWNEDSDMAINLFYDQSERSTPSYVYKPRTYDVDAQHRFNVGANHQITWGLGYRLVSDESVPSQTYSLNPSSRDMHLYTAFTQDRWTLQPDRLFFIFGSKFEHNDLTGIEIQPSLRLLWTPTDKQTYWAAMSRAVHTPTRHDYDNLTCMAQAGPSLLTLNGSTTMDSEKLTAYELGYRIQPHTKWILDIAGYFNNYAELRTSERRVVGTNIQRVYENQMSGEGYGIELSANYQATHWWRWHGGYTFGRLALHRDPGSSYSREVTEERNTPRNQVFLRSLIDLPHRFEFDTMLRYEDNAGGASAQHYTELDVRLGWQLADHTELSLVGQNLLNRDHIEFITVNSISNTQVQRAWYLKLVHLIP